MVVEVEEGKEEEGAGKEKRKKMTVVRTKREKRGGDGLRVLAEE